jgi:hypothetical protein
MSTSKLIVCESSTRWAVALRRSLAQDSHLLVETRSLAACGRELEACPASLLAIEAVASNLESVLAAWMPWSRRFPDARLAIVGDLSLEPAEPLLREAGACAVVTSLRHAPRVARLAWRHIGLAPRRELSLRESIWQRLPWSRYAASPA